MEVPYAIQLLRRLKKNQEYAYYTGKDISRDNKDCPSARALLDQIRDEAEKLFVQGKVTLSTRTKSITTHGVSVLVTEYVATGT